MLFLSFFVLDIKFHFFLGEGLLGKKLLTTRSNLVDYTCKLNQRLMKDYKHQNTQLKFYNLICNNYKMCSLPHEHRIIMATHLRIS